MKRAWHRGRLPLFLLLPSLGSLVACSVIHVSTPFYSTTSKPAIPTETDELFLDELAKTTPALAGDVERVRQEMREKGEDRYWASQQLLTTAAERDPILAALVKTDNEYRSPYVSAKVCGECHPKHFDEWSVSPHAYAQLSPVFNAMHGTVVKLTGGSNGDFCIRCHTQVGMNLSEPAFVPNAKRNITSREGITCVVCHRVGLDFGKVSGRLAFLEGTIFGPVYGPTDDTILKETIAKHDLPSSEADKDKPGQKVHGSVTTLPMLKQPSFCGMCHDVTLGNTFRLEEAFSDYKTSPAPNKGITCQDCHMGKVPGEPKGYDYGAAAIVAGEPTRTRRLTNHMIAGPDYSIIHPGLFPHLPPAYGNPDKQIESPVFAELTPGRWKLEGGKYEPIPLWLDFDYQGDWGKTGYEADLEKVAGEVEELGFGLEEADEAGKQKIQAEIAAKLARFPDFKSWGGKAPQDPDALTQWLEKWGQVRKKARRILEFRQYRLLHEYRKQQEAVLRAGYQIEEIKVDRLGPEGLSAVVRVKNATDGHSAPVGFDAERSVFLQVGVFDAEGKAVFASGDVDPNGDVRDLHSVFVHHTEPGTKEPLWWMPLEMPEAQPVDPWREPTGHIERGESAVAVDPFLFSLQSKFIVRLNRGGEREQVLAVNQSLNPIPFIRPPTRSNILTGKPLPARTQRKGIEPLGTRNARYVAGAFEGHQGPFTLRVRLVTGMVPVNLIEAISGVGFDYGYSGRELARTLVNGYATEVPQPTTISERGLVKLPEEGDPKAEPAPRVRDKITGRQVLWEYELKQGESTPRRLIPAEPTSK